MSEERGVYLTVYDLPPKGYRFKDIPDDHVTTYCPVCGRDAIFDIGEIGKYTIEICRECGYEVKSEVRNGYEQGRIGGAR